MITAHALAMIFVVFYTFVAVLLTFQVMSRSVNELVMSVIPVIVIGLLFSLLLNIDGIPFYEWLFPGISILVIALFSGSDNLNKFNRWFMLMASVYLCISHSMLVSNGYTSSPNRTERIYSQIVEGQMDAIRDRLMQLYPHNSELPRCPVSNLLQGDERRNSIIDTVYIKKGWYTPITRLYSVQKQKKEIWYSGGILNRGHLFLPKKQS